MKWPPLLGDRGSLLSNDIVDSCWSSFNTIHLSVASACIPSKLLPLHPLPLWISRFLVPIRWSSDNNYHKAKTFSSPSTLSMYPSFLTLDFLFPCQIKLRQQLYHKAKPFPLHPLFLAMYTVPFKTQYCISIFTYCFNSNAPPLDPFSPFLPLPCPELLCACTWWSWCCCHANRPCTLICDWDQNVRTLEVLQSNRNVAICACERESLYMYIIQMWTNVHGHCMIILKCSWSPDGGCKAPLIAWISFYRFDYKFWFHFEPGNRSNHCPLFMWAILNFLLSVNSLSPCGTSVHIIRR